MVVHTLSITSTYFFFVAISVQTSCFITIIWPKLCISLHIIIKRTLTF